MYIHTPIDRDSVDSKLRRIDQRGKRKKKKHKRGAYEFGYADSSGSSHNGNRIPGQRKNSTKPPKANSVKVWKIIFTVLVLGVFGVFYLNHIFATQQILEEVNRLEREYKEAQIIHNDRKLLYERLTGPTYIYPKAKELGFINGGPAEKVLELDLELEPSNNNNP